MRTFGFIGSGHITEAILRRLLSSGGGDQYLCADVSSSRLDYIARELDVATTGDNLELVDRSDVIILALPPQAAANVLQSLSGRIPASKLIISVMAGVPMAALEKLGDRLSVIRMGPNPPARVGMSITAIVANDRVSKGQMDTARGIADSLGLHLVCSEEKLDIIMALFSPAPVYLFAEAMVDAGVRAGLTWDESRLVVRQTMYGCMRLWADSGLDASTLREQASTPGGVSVEMLQVLERAGFRGLVSESVKTGVDRCRLLGREAARELEGDRGLLVDLKQRQDPGITA